MVSIMEIMQLCRLCLVKEQVNIPIFEDQGDIRQIFLKITACLPVKVTKEDKLPKKICDGCLYKLELLYQFWNTTVNAEKQLLAWINQANMDTSSKSTELPVQSQPQEHTVKQEKIEPESTNENADLSTDTQSYILQQQQLAYQANFPYKESQVANADAGDASENSDEPLSKRRKRRQATKPIPPESLDSSENEAADSFLEMAVTKTEEESESDGDENIDDPEPSTFVAIDTEDREQPGPSGLGKGATDAPALYQDSTYSNFNYEQNMASQADESMQSKYYMMMKNTPDLPDSNLLENAVAQLNDSDTDLLNLLAAEDDILRDITDNEHFEQLISNGVMEAENEYIVNDTLTENITELMKNDDFSEFCNTKTDSTKDRDNNISLQNSTVSQKFDKLENKCENFKCTYCEKICSTRKLLKNHMMIHTGSRPYSCDVCNKTFRHNYEVTVHKKSHSEPTFQCDICSKMFIHKSHLTVHRRKHLGDFVVVCETCNKGFISQSAYNHHVRVKHQKIRHICEFCGAQLSSISALKEHKLTHEPNYRQERIHVCEYCGKSYLNARHLRSHMKGHTEASAFVCNICGKSLTTKSNLRKHIANHNGEKRFRCTFCSKDFNTKENLITHERIHTGDKPFSCNICDKTFSQKVSLTIHMRYHTGERPYKCDCGKAFLTKGKLVGHFKTHSANVNVPFVS